MLDIRDIHNLLEEKRFQVIEEDTSASFGDYFSTFSDGFINIRISRSKSFETVDISNAGDNENWYDLPLIKALIFNEKKLTKITPINENFLFLKGQFDEIRELFSERNYPIVKDELNKLRTERMKQMFPDMRC